MLNLACVPEDKSSSRKKFTMQKNDGVGEGRGGF